MWLYLHRRFCGKRWIESVIEEFKNVKDMPNWGKNRALPAPNRTVLKVYIYAVNYRPRGMKLFENVLTHSEVIDFWRRSSTTGGLR